MKERIDKLKLNPRVTAVTQLDQTLKELAARVRNEELPQEERDTAAEEFKSLSVEYQSLAKEMDDFLFKEKKKATENLVETIEELIALTRVKVNEIAKEEGYDLVLEVGGHTSTQVSSIIYLRSGTEITQLVTDRINEPLSTEEEPTQSPELGR